MSPENEREDLTENEREDLIENLSPTSSISSHSFERRDTPQNRRSLAFYLFYYFLFNICPSLVLLTVLVLLTWYMTPTLDAALLICGSPGRGRTTSSRAGTDLGRTLDSRV